MDPTYYSGRLSHELRAHVALRAVAPNAEASSPFHAALARSARAEPYRFESASTNVSARSGSLWSPITLSSAVAMQTLDVEGPYEVPYSRNEQGAKSVEPLHGRAFFAEQSDLVERRGCYLFAIRNRGLRAVYVGKATQGFGQEVFAVDKLNKLNRALHKWAHGTPVVLFVVTPPRVHSTKLITDVEEYLIRSAKRVFPELLNKQHAGADNWEIAGVTSPHRGRRSEPQTELARLLDFERD